MSLRRTPEPPAFLKDKFQKADQLEADAEKVGTSYVSSDDVGRRALRPQPSWDPNDPLNWSTWQKCRTLFTVCFFSFLSTTNASKFIFATGLLRHEFQKSRREIEYVVAFNMLALGSGSLFWVPLARVIGKRPIILLSLPLLLAANVWSFSTHSYRQLFASSVLSGFAASAGQATVPAIVTDLFFVHERGTLMMVFSFSLSCGFFLGPVINAFAIEYSGWRTVCGWLAIATGVNWAVAILCVQETSYYGRDIYAGFSTYGPKKSHLKRLGLADGWNKNEGLMGALSKCLAVASYPAVLWAGLLAATFVGWNVVIEQQSIFHFIRSPYRYSRTTLGLLNLSLFIGSLLAIFFGGKAIDMVSNRLSITQRGRREPEYRLYGLILPAVVGPMGILLFGLTITEHRHWIIPTIGMAMHGFGITTFLNVLLVYIIDCYAPLAAEVSAIVFMLKGLVEMCMVFWSKEWVRGAGEKFAWGQMVGVMYFFALFGVLFVLCGKVIRARTARWGPVAWMER